RQQLFMRLRRTPADEKRYTPPAIEPMPQVGSTLVPRARQQFDPCVPKAPPSVAPFSESTQSSICRSGTHRWPLAS
ncbi:MAG TPA: hypothetical protein VHK27_11705, partial [Gammaproteobacteria bacterium]|nr:hypothetical protein [Gammaproteobacteria bacterium]